MLIHSIDDSLFSPSRNTAMKKTIILSTLLSALFLSGCQAINEKRAQIDSREETLTNVVGQVWRLDAQWPGVVLTNDLTEHLYNKGLKHCHEQGLGFLAIRGASTEGKADGSHPASAWLEYRCQRALDYRPEYKGITKTVNPDDLTDLLNTEK